MHSESILMYFDSMQMCYEGIPLHFANIRANFESMRMLLKTKQMQFEGIRIYMKNI